MASKLELQASIKGLAAKAVEIKDATDLTAAEKNERLDALQADLKGFSDELSVIEKANQFVTGGDVAPETIEEKAATVSPANIGDAVLNSAEYKSAVDSINRRANFSRTVDVKSPLGEAVSSSIATPAALGAGQYFQAGTAGPATLPNFLPGITDLRFQPLVVADLFSQGSTDAPVISYVKESSFTNNAAAVSEAAVYPYSDDAITRVVEQVGKLAHALKVTDEMLQDAPAYTSFLNGRLLLGLQLKEQSQLLNGTGYPGVPGLLGRTGFQTSVAVGASPTAAAIMEGIFQQMTNVRANAFIEPDAIVINPIDWQTIRLGKDANAQYYAGGPFTGAYGVGGNPAGDYNSLWGLKVVVTPAIASGTIVVGGFKECAQIFRRQGITVEMTNSNVDDFEKGLITVRAEQRLALAVYRPGGFGLVTHT